MNISSCPIPQEDKPEEPKKVIRLAKHQTENANTIQSLASNRWYAFEDANLLDLADDLNTYPGIPAVAVTDANGRLLGQIIRNDLLDLLGRPFGRDILQKETVVRVARNTKTFRSGDSIQKVCEEIGSDNIGAESGYFPIRTSKGEFTGIFSIQDLLINMASRFREENQHSATFQHRILKEMQIQEGPEQDILATTFRVATDNSEFCHLRQYDSSGWNLSLCAPRTTGPDTGLIVSFLWGVANSFDLHKGLMNYVRHLNALIHRTLPLQTGLNGLFLDYQSETGGVLLCDHGNGLGFIYRGGKVLRMKTTDKPSAIGTTAQLTTGIFKYQLQDGDRLFLLGNGMVEQTNAAGENYGPSRIKELMEANKDITVRDLRLLIQADFKAFRASVPQSRDAALFILHRKKNGAVS